MYNIYKLFRPTGRETRKHCMDSICNQGLCFKPHSSLVRIQLHKSHGGGSWHRYIILPEHCGFWSTMRGCCTKLYMFRMYGSHRYPKFSWTYCCWTHCSVLDHRNGQNRCRVADTCIIQLYSFEFRFERDACSSEDSKAIPSMTFCVLIWET